MAGPCLNFKVADGMHFYMIVHVDSYVFVYSDPPCFKAGLVQFQGDPDTDSRRDAKLLVQVANLLQIRIFRTWSTQFSDEER